VSVGPNPAALLRDRRYVVVLVLAAIVGVIASLAAWLFLDLLSHMQSWVYDDLPDSLGFDSRPTWWPLPILALAGLITAVAIVRLPGTGGHVPAQGLNASPTHAIELPGVILAALASVGLGAVVGPEAPLIALGGGLGYLVLGALRRDAPPQLADLIAASGTFAAISFLFGSPLIAAVLLLEASGIGGARMRLVLIPGMLAAGIGSLVSIGLGSWTGVDTSSISIDPIALPNFTRPDLTDFLWTLPLAAAIAVGIVVIFKVGKRVVPLAARREFVVLPAVGLVVGGLAILYSQVADKTVNDVLFSGQDDLSPLVARATDYSIGTLALLIGCKGLAYSLCLGSLRGGPVFPALFLGAAAGLMASHLPGFELTPAVAVGLTAATAAALRLPLAAVVLGVVLTEQSGFGVDPLVIVAGVTAYLVAEAVEPGPIPGEPVSPDPVSYPEQGQPAAAASPQAGR
jgi:H+/Cl- antiporter ClcA